MNYPVFLHVVIEGEAKQALVHGDHPQAILSRGESLLVTDEMRPIRIEHKPTLCEDIMSEVTLSGITVVHTGPALSFHWNNRLTPDGWVQHIQLGRALVIEFDL